MKKNIVSFFLITSLLILLSCEKNDTEEEVTNIHNKPQVESELAENVQNDNSIPNSDKSSFYVSEGRYNPEMAFVEGGEFIMGDESVKTNQPHPVKLSSFYVAKYMVTTGEWKAFLEDVQLEFTWDWESSSGYGPFYNIVPTDDCPAQGLNWYYAILFCNWASLKDGYQPAYLIEKLPKEFEDIKVKWDKKANGYRLPTDAEWEYASYGGKLSKGYLYPGSNEPSDIGKFVEEIETSYPVGQFKPNELGIYDMGGNASEWCWDWYDEIMFKWLPIENPSVDASIDVKKKSDLGYDLKVRRGAAWNTSSKMIERRGAYQPQNIAFTGIRLVRNAE